MNRKRKIFCRYLDGLLLWLLQAFWLMLMLWLLLLSRVMRGELDLSELPEHSLFSFCLGFSGLLLLLLLEMGKAIQHDLFGFYRKLFPYLFFPGIILVFLLLLPSRFPLLQPL